MTALQLYVGLLILCFLMIALPLLAIGAAWLWRHRPRFTSDYPAIGERGRTPYPDDFGYRRTR